MNRLGTILIVVLTITLCNYSFSQGNKKLAKKRVEMLKFGADMKVDSATYYLSLKLLKKETKISIPDTGIRIFKWPNGNMQFRGYLAEGGIFLGLREYWLENGIKKSEEICVRSDKFYNDCKCSYKNLWLDNGEQIIKDGDGYYITYHNNGQLQIKGEYKNGKKFGEWIWYYSNGKIHYISNYKDGLEDGIWKFYKEDGSLQYETENKNGVSIKTTHY